MAQPQLDVLIIGGGHNGLVCACYLAAPFPNFVPLPDGRHLKFGGGETTAQQEVAKFSPRDAVRLPEYFARLHRIASLLKEWLLRAPPNLGGSFIVRGWRDLAGAARLLRGYGRLPRAGQQDLVDVFTRSAGDWLDSIFESEPLKAVLGWDAVVGNYASPYAAGTAYGLLHNGIGEVNGKTGAWGHVLGGMGRITELMADEARDRGVRIDLGTEVEQVLIERGRAVGVRLAGGGQIRARAIAASVNPRLLYGRLVERGALPEDFAAAIERYRCASGALRINVALAGLPDFTCLPGTQPQAHHGSGIVFAPSLACMDRAWCDAQARGFAAQPIVEMLIPSVVDDTLAPKGAHVASLFCQHFRPDADWDRLKPQAVEAVFDVVHSYCPNFRRALLGHRALSPLDLEREFGLIGGDIFHGRMTLDQLFSLRPVLGYARYRGPISALYHCGAGAHPGGGVSGAPGHNAAMEILRDLA
jgi:phytoene dehydrogenase-like protein